MNTILLIVALIIGGLFIIYQADASLDFYGSIGFDMFDRDNKPFTSDDNDNDNEDIKVNVNLGKAGNDKAGYPDITVKAGDEKETIHGKEFKGDGKSSTNIQVDDDSDRVCIQIEDIDFKSCKKITNDDKVNFDLRDE